MFIVFKQKIVQMMRKQMFIYKDFCLRILCVCMMMTDVIRKRKQKLNCVISLFAALFENLLQTFSFKFLFSVASFGSFCPDNDPGQPQLPEIPLFFRALISLTVGSCN